MSNQTIKASEAAYRQALAVADAANAGFFPTLSLDGSGQRSKSHATVKGAGGASASAVTSAYSTSLGASWELDLWGRIRRTVEADEASAAASAADLAGARLSAQASLAADYFALRSEDALKHVLEATVAAYERSLAITRNQYAAGMAARADVAQAETQLASTRAQLIAVGVQRAQLDHAIAVLIGRPPADFSVADDAKPPMVPGIPSGVPSVLLQRRPDIAAAERRVASANAEIGVAVAAYFPTLTLSGSDGFSASTLGSLLQASNNVWTVGPQLAMTVFDGGLRSAQVDQARAAYDQSAANYRQTVLTAMSQPIGGLAGPRTGGRGAGPGGRLGRGSRASGSQPISGRNGVLHQRRHRPGDGAFQSPDRPVHRTKPPGRLRQPDSGPRWGMGRDAIGRDIRSVTLPAVKMSLVRGDRLGQWYALAEKGGIHGDEYGNI